MERFLHGVEVIEIQSGSRPIRTVQSGVIGLIGTAPKGPVNQPVLIPGSRREALRSFGSGLGTLPDALDAIFDQAGATVVAINVLDPDTHKAAVAEKEYTFGEDGTLTLDHRYARNLEVKSSDGNTTYTEKTDYTHDPDTGVLARVAAGTIGAGATVKIAYDRPDETAVGVSDVIGGVDAGAESYQAVAAKDYPFGNDGTLTLPHRNIRSLEVKSSDGNTTYAAVTDYTHNPDTGVLTRVASGSIGAGATAVKIAYEAAGVDPGTGAYQGVHALLSAESEVKVQPKILIAPGFTSQVTRTARRITGAPVVAEMVAIAERLRAVIIADGPNTTDAEAIAYRELFDSRRVFVVDPWLKVWDTEANAEALEGASARVAGLIAKSDDERGFWFSPSNREIARIIGTSRAVDFTLGDASARANQLNAQEVATIIQQNGYRLWGNRTCATDPKWAFLSVVRTADAINESLLRAHLWAVDRNITKTYLEDVAEGVNAYLRHLTGSGAILGGRCWHDPELNSKDQIKEGKVYFNFDFTPPYPAEQITFRSALVDDYIEEIA